jgi:aryl-alcohol dehydrogenase-like predicted oxidoreductase
MSNGNTSSTWAPTGSRSFSNLCKEIGEKEFIVAIAWTLANPVVSSAIVGIRTVEHLDGLRNYNWIGQL